MPDGADAVAFLSVCSGVGCRRVSLQECSVRDVQAVSYDRSWRSVARSGGMMGCVAVNIGPRLGLSRPSPAEMCDWTRVWEVMTIVTGP